MPREPEKVKGMEKLKRARKRKPETSQSGPAAISLQSFGGQGVHREMESERHEEKYRAVIDGGCPEDEPVGQRWARSSLHYGGEGVLIHPPHQGVCGRHGTEEQRGACASQPGQWRSGRAKPGSLRPATEFRVE